MSQSPIMMHELGHAFGVGWADDTAISGSVSIPKTDKEITFDVIDQGMEVYSGDVDGEKFEPDVTPEYLIIDGELEPEWSVMSRDIRDTRQFAGTEARQPVVAFSIEELSTISFSGIPTKEE